MPWLDRSLLNDTDVIKPAVALSPAPERVAKEEPPEDWTPPLPVGFVR